MSLHWIHTSDVHGYLDALQGIEQHVNELKIEYGSANVILTDGGDVLQGHPCVYYHNFIDIKSPHVVAETMNRMGYDCMAVGNHDIETGHDVYDRVIPQFHFPALCANITKDGTDECYFPPYYIIERGGLRIVILSLITPETTHWLSPSQYEGMTFNDPIESARYWINQIKEIEQYDLLVGLFHIGWSELSYMSETDGSFALLQEFNLILYGHDHHQGIHKIGNTLCVAPSSQATSFVSLEIDTETKAIKAQSVKTECGRSIPLNQNYDTWLNSKIGQVDKDLLEFDSYFGQSSFLTLIHELQMKATHAQVSLAAPISYDAFIPRGPLTNRDIFTLYNRDSQLYTMRFTLSEIKAILEYSYSLWTNVMTTSEDHALLLDYLLDGGTRLCLKNFTINFLTAYGLDYTVDLTQPYGNKVSILNSPRSCYASDQSSMTGDEKLLVAINSFHANGGGNILTKGTGLSYTQLRKRIIKVEKYDLRKCLAGELKKVGDYHSKDINNWHFIPEGWAQVALARDREILVEKYFF